MAKELDEIVVVVVPLALLRLAIYLDVFLDDVLYRRAPVFYAAELLLLFLEF